MAAAFRIGSIRHGRAWLNFLIASGDFKVSCILPFIFIFQCLKEPRLLEQKPEMRSLIIFSFLTMAASKYLLVEVHDNVDTVQNKGKKVRRTDLILLYNRYDFLREILIRGIYLCFRKNSSSSDFTDFRVSRGTIKSSSFSSSSLKKIFGL